MTAVRAVRFDLDGTLFDHRGAARAGAAAFLEGLGVTATESALAAWSAAEDVQFERWRSGRISFRDQRRERLRVVLPPLGLAVPDEDAALDALSTGTCTPTELPGERSRTAARCSPVCVPGGTGSGS